MTGTYHRKNEGDEKEKRMGESRKKKGGRI